MRCFRHFESYAIGSCKVCNKGLCIDCAADLGHALACKGVHEEAAANYKKLQNAQSRAIFSTPWLNYLFPSVLLFLGMLFIFIGLRSGDGVFSLPFVYGVLSFVYGGVMLIRARKLLGSRN